MPAKHDEAVGARKTWPWLLGYGGEYEPSGVYVGSGGKVQDLMSRLPALPDTWIDVECPGCGFPFEVQIVDVVSQVWRRCQCCHLLIRLVDDRGSMTTGLAEVDAALRAFEKALGKMFK